MSDPKSRPEGRPGAASGGQTPAAAGEPSRGDTTLADDAAVSARLTAGRKRTRLSRLARWALVLPLLVLWIVFWILPGVPGIQFLIVALFLMAPDFPAARRLATWFQRKLPKIRRRIPKRWRVTKDLDP
jgi:hypothetical protein